MSDWSSELPTEPGYYWWRDVPEVRLVRLRLNGGQLEVRAFSKQWSRDLGDWDYGEWQRVQEPRL